jgi:hypothetical protein
MNKDSAHAPPTMPLFYWSDERGYWIEDGTATLEEAEAGKWAYAGDVSHFTVWNADLRVPTVQVWGCVEDSAGKRVANAPLYAVFAERDDNANHGAVWGHAEPNGEFDMPSTADWEIRLSVLKNTPTVIPRVPLVSRVLRTGSEAMVLTPCLTVPASGAFVLDTSQLDDPSYRLQ